MIPDSISLIFLFVGSSKIIVPVLFSIDKKYSDPGSVVAKNTVKGLPAFCLFNEWPIKFSISRS